MLGVLLAAAVGAMFTRGSWLFTPDPAVQAAIAQLAPIAMLALGICAGGQIMLQYWRSWVSAFAPAAGIQATLVVRGSHEQWDSWTCWAAMGARPRPLHVAIELHTCSWPLRHTAVLALSRSHDGAGRLQRGQRQLPPPAARQRHGAGHGAACTAW